MNLLIEIINWRKFSFCVNKNSWQNAINVKMRVRTCFVHTWNGNARNQHQQISEAELCLLNCYCCVKCKQRADHCSTCECGFFYLLVSHDKLALCGELSFCYSIDNWQSQQQTEENAQWKISEIIVIMLKADTEHICVFNLIMFVSCGHHLTLCSPFSLSMFDFLCLHLRSCRISIYIFRYFSWC